MSRRVARLGGDDGPEFFVSLADSFSNPPVVEQPQKVDISSVLPNLEHRKRLDHIRHLIGNELLDQLTEKGIKFLVGGGKKQYPEDQILYEQILDRLALADVNYNDLGRTTRIVHAVRDRKRRSQNGHHN